MPLKTFDHLKIQQPGWSKEEHQLDKSFEHKKTRINSNWAFWVVAWTCLAMILDALFVEIETLTHPQIGTVSVRWWLSNSCYTYSHCCPFFLDYSKWRKLNMFWSPINFHVTKRKRWHVCDPFPLDTPTFAHGLGGRCIHRLCILGSKWWENGWREAMFPSGIFFFSWNCPETCRQLDKHPKILCQIQYVSMSLFKTIYNLLFLIVGFLRQSCVLKPMVKLRRGSSEKLTCRSKLPAAFGIPRQTTTQVGGVRNG